MLDDGDHEAARPILAGHVHGEAEIDAVGHHAVGRLILHRQEMAHDRMLADALDQCPRDQVGERDLLIAAGSLERGIQRLPLCLQPGHRQLPESGGGRHGQALVHVLDEAERGTFYLKAIRAGGTGRAGGFLRGGFRRRRVGAILRGRLFPHHAALEQLPPFRTHRGRVSQVVLVQGLSETRIGGFEDVQIHDCSCAPMSDQSRRNPSDSRKITSLAEPCSAHQD